MNVRPKMRDVARAAGVSAATVSNVLNARRNVDPAIAARVRAAVSTLGYRVDAAAANLRRTQSRLVGLVIPDFQNPFFGELVSSLERLAEENGFRLTVVSSREDGAIEAAQIQTLIDWRVAGLIVVPAAGPFHSREIIEQSRVTAIMVDRASDITGFDSVAVDNEVIAGRAMRYLNGLGHRRILLAASSEKIANMNERVDGAICAAEAAGIAAAVQLVYCGTTVGEAIGALTERLQAAVVPTSIFALYNTATLAALKAVRQCGMSVPADISVIGFDDYEWMQVADPPVTVISQPIGDMAQAAWQRLMLRLGGSGKQAEQVRIPCALEIRGSVAPPGAADQTMAGRASAMVHPRSQRPGTSVNRA